MSWCRSCRVSSIIWGGSYGHQENRTGGYDHDRVMLGFVHLQSIRLGAFPPRNPVHLTKLSSITETVGEKVLERYSNITLPSESKVHRKLARSWKFLGPNFLLFRHLKTIWQNWIIWAKLFIQPYPLLIRIQHYLGCWSVQNHHLRNQKTDLGENTRKTNSCPLSQKPIPMPKLWLRDPGRKPLFVVSLSGGVVLRDADGSNLNALKGHPAEPKYRKYWYIEEIWRTTKISMYLSILYLEPGGMQK